MYSSKKFSGIFCVISLCVIAISSQQLQVEQQHHHQIQQLSLIDPSQHFRYDAPDDCKYSIIKNEDIMLECKLRTVNSEFDTTNFSVIPADHTASLSILCNSDLGHKSKLEPKSFSNLMQLRELSLEHCKFVKLYSEIFNGNNDLRNLSIRTHNINWPGLNLEIEPNTFHYLKKLERLDLSANNIWSLADNLFCPLNVLQFLNVSSNRLQDINDLGFREKSVNEMSGMIYEMPHKNGSLLEHLQAMTGIKVKKVASPTPTQQNQQQPSGTSKNNCETELETLDISFNNFVLLPSNGFATLKRLKMLKINNNEISMLADNALDGLKNLQIIDLSSNKIVALPSKLLKDPSQSVQQIYLQNNSLIDLSPGLFSNLDHLLALDLSINQLTSTCITKNTFKNLIRLVLLNLSKNKITKLEPEIFSDLYSLQILDLCYNLLESIDADTFSLMSNLHTLLLSHNKIKYLDAYSLNGLYVLSLLSIDNNALTGIHPEAFRNCSSLQNMHLFENELTKIPLALKDMRLLKTLDLGENLISALEEPGFRGMNNLYGLRLMGNRIENISRSSFREVPGLQILNLARNQIRNIEKGSFDQSMSVQAIRLDGNLLSQVDGLFTNMPNLLWINISDNKLEQFDYSQIPIKLQWLDIHKNELTELSNSYGLYDQLHLQTLDASFNQLGKVTATSIPNSVEMLFLNDNLIQEVEAHTFLHKKNLTRVDLYANRITSLDIKALRLMPYPEDRLLPEFYIGGNPFICDCTIEWLKTINDLNARQYPKIMDIDTIYCKLLYNRDKSYVRLIEAEPHHFLCAYNLHCFALCDCCDQEDCACEMQCPNNCTCFHDQTWDTNIVECSSSTYRDVPKTLPIDTTELYMDGANLVDLGPHSFTNKKKLKVLYANNSNIHTIQNGTLTTLHKLLILHLEHNKLQKLIGHEFNALENLRELYLQDNKLAQIDTRTFQELKKLEVIRLDGNKLIKFEIWYLTYNPYLVEIALADNSWSCDCHYLNKLQIYLHSNMEKIVDFNRMACVYNNYTNVLKEKNGTMCTLMDGMSSIVYAKQIQDLLPFLLAATCAFVGFFGLILGIFCYRKELKFWLQNNCASFFFCCGYKTRDFLNDYSDKDRLYDAYFIYSLQDEHFVNQVLTNTLENESGYRLCLHYRDFNLNVNNYISNTIEEAIDNSKRAVLVLSKNFLYNEWGRFEFKGAVHEVLKRRRKLVIILYGDIPQKDLDADIRLYLKTNLCIEWDDKKFWQKLRLALPSIAINKNKHCLGDRSSINIYATAQHPQALPTSQYPLRSHDYNTITPVNRASTLHHAGGNPLLGNGPSALRMDGYAAATINNHQPKLCDNYEQIGNCKFNTMQPPTNLVGLNNRVHEYAVPINCSLDGTVNNKRNNCVLIGDNCNSSVDTNNCNIADNTFECNNKYTSFSTSSLSNGSSEFCTRSLSSPSNNHCIEGYSNDNLNVFDGVIVGGTNSSSGVLMTSVSQHNGNLINHKSNHNNNNNSISGGVNNNLINNFNISCNSNNTKTMPSTYYCNSASNNHKNNNTNSKIMNTAKSDNKMNIIAENHLLISNTQNPTTASNTATTNNNKKRRLPQEMLWA